MVTIGCDDKSSDVLNPSVKSTVILYNSLNKLKINRRYLDFCSRVEWLQLR